MDFTTKELAEKAVKGRGTPPIGFCPAINAQCRPDCVSYQKPYATTNYQSYPKKEYHFLCYESCTNPMITGTIDMNPLWS